MADEYENIVTLTDATGEEADYEILDVVPYGDGSYAVLLPVDDDSDEPEAVILQVLPGKEESDEDTLVGISDQSLLDAVFEEFKKRNKDDFDFGE